MVTRRAGRRWAPILVLVGALASGCASLNDRAPLDPSLAPQPARGYLYGRFKLHPGSRTAPRLLVQLSRVGTGEFLTVHLQHATQELHLIDVVPGRYQFTHLLFVPVGAMDMDVRRDALVFPAEMGFMGAPFDVEAGKAYYVGDWVGALSREVDFYVVFSKIKQRWGISRLVLDYEGATAELRRLYPPFAPIETRAAWHN